MTWEEVIKRRKIIIPKKYGNKQKIKVIRKETRGLVDILVKLESEYKRFDEYRKSKVAKEFPEVRMHFIKVAEEIKGQIDEVKSQIDKNQKKVRELEKEVKE